MEQLGVDMTYGTALFEAAGDVDKVDQIRLEAEEVLATLAQEPDFDRFFQVPGIPAEEKKAVLQRVYGNRLSAELLHFLYILIDKGRVRHLGDIVKIYGELADRAAGLAAGEVHSAVPLKEDQIRRLEEETGKLMGERVQLTNRVDPALLGGVKVMVDGKIFDATIRKRVDDLRQQME